MSSRIILFNLHFLSKEGSKVQVKILDRNSKLIESIKMNSYDNEFWTCFYETDEKKELSYKIEKVGRNINSSLSPVRTISLLQNEHAIFVHESLQPDPSPKEIFHSSAFRDIIFNRKRQSHKRGSKTVDNKLEIVIHAPDIPSNYQVGIVGNTPELGVWEEAQLMEVSQFPHWSFRINWPADEINLEYKFVLVNKKSQEIKYWESGENRKIKFSFPNAQTNRFIHHDSEFRYHDNLWKGAGIAIPVFSLRSRKSFGIGEFTDLKPMIDFASDTGMKILQTLPVNDTIANKNWKDSYPYSAISIFALHPLYVNIAAIADFKDKKIVNKYNKDLKELNGVEDVDFVKVLEKKLWYLEYLYDQEKLTLKDNKGYRKFKTENSWLQSYSVFCALRDKYGSAIFNVWPEFSIYNEKEIRNLLQKDAEINDKAEFYSFIQYHAHQQLIDARLYGQQKGIVLKGDLPIGIYRHSCDAWIAPELYNMNEQAGAPPDAYSVLGQNWGFPTYNWEVMANDGYKWWQDRMIKLSEFFDALRIDHILGFFRIWQIPTQHIQGTLGMFNPRLPYTAQELYKFGLNGDLLYYTQPRFTTSFLYGKFGSLADLLIHEILQISGNEVYSFKPEFDGQVALKKYIDTSDNDELKAQEKEVLSLFGEVLLIEEPGSGGQKYNPRITLHSTQIYKNLDGDLKRVFDAIYWDYYFVRHEKYWKEQATSKLPALLNATNMFICGEDLGMIPASVPEVMKSMNIVTLEIQRMSKGNSPFGIPYEYPYYSVCSPSCHDMSTIRGWWEGDENIAQKYFNHYMGRYGDAPKKCDPWLVEYIVMEHLKAKSMLAIFPIQDLLGLSKDLRREDPYSEQINDPSNSNQHWKYRMHINLEDLNKEAEFKEKISDLIKYSGRNGFQIW